MLAVTCEVAVAVGGAGTPEVAPHEALACRALLRYSVEHDRPALGPPPLRKAKRSAPAARSRRPPLRPARRRSRHRELCRCALPDRGARRHGVVSALYRLSRYR